MDYFVNKGISDRLELLLPNIQILYFQYMLRGQKIISFIKVVLIIFMNIQYFLKKSKPINEIVYPATTF